MEGLYWRLKVRIDGNGKIGTWAETTLLRFDQSIYV